MNNTSKTQSEITGNNSPTPPDQDNSYPDLNLNLFKTLFPHATNFDDGVDMALSDAHGFIVDRVTGQVQLLQDLGNKITCSEDLDGQALAFTAESINRQLAVLDLIHSEFFQQFRDKEEQFKVKIKELEQEQLILKKNLVEREIEKRKFKQEIKELKGGDL